MYREVKTTGACLFEGGLYFYLHGNTQILNIFLTHSSEVYAHRPTWKRQLATSPAMPPAQLLLLTQTRKTIFGSSCFKITPVAISMGSQ